MSGAHRPFTRWRAVSAIPPAIVLAVVCRPPYASAQIATPTQAQCELSAIRDTRSPFAVQTIHSACNWLAVNGESAMNESLKPYYLCLVQNLSGAQSDAAAGAIVSACRAANPG